MSTPLLDKYKTAAGNVKVSFELTDEQLNNIAKCNEKPVEELTMEEITSTLVLLIDDLFSM